MDECSKNTRIHHDVGVLFGLLTCFLRPQSILRGLSALHAVRLLILSVCPGVVSLHTNTLTQHTHIMTHTLPLAGRN